MFEFRTIKIHRFTIRSLPICNSVLFFIMRIKKIWLVYRPTCTLRLHSAIQNHLSKCNSLFLTFFLHRRETINKSEFESFITACPSISSYEETYRRLTIVDWLHKQKLSGNSFAIFDKEIYT